jgi:hypothetical protein
MSQATIFPKPVHPRDSLAVATQRMDEAKRRYTAAACATLHRDPAAATLAAEALEQVEAARAGLRTASEGSPKETANA